MVTAAPPGALLSSHQVTTRIFPTGCQLPSPPGVLSERREMVGGELTQKESLPPPEGKPAPVLSRDPWSEGRTTHLAGFRGKDGDVKLQKLAGHLSTLKARNRFC